MFPFRLKQFFSTRSNQNTLCISLIFQKFPSVLMYRNHFQKQTELFLFKKSSWILSTCFGSTIKLCLLKFTLPHFSSQTLFLFNRTVHFKEKASLFVKLFHQTPFLLNRTIFLSTSHPSRLLSIKPFSFNQYGFCDQTLLFQSNCLIFKCYLFKHFFFWYISSLLAFLFSFQYSTILIKFFLWIRFFLHGFHSPSFNSPHNS